MCELPEPIKGVLFIAITCLLVDLVEEGSKIVKGHTTKWSMPTLLAGVTLVGLMSYITYYYW